MLAYRKQIQTLLLAALVVVVTACSPPTAGSGDPPAESTAEPPAAGDETEIPDLPIALENIDWYLRSYGPDDAESELLPGTQITLRLEDGQLSGGAGCNQYFGDYDWSGESLTVGVLGSTDMWCEDEGRMDQEGSYLTLLGQVVTVQRDGELMILEGNDGRLVYAESPAETDTPQDAIELDGTEWVLKSYGPAGAEIEPIGEISLRFEEGGLGGTAGCNSYFGDYQLDGESFTVGILGNTEMWCEGLMDQESAYLALLGGVKTVRMEGELLVLEGPEGRLTFAPPAPLADRPMEGIVWELETLITGEMAQSPLSGSRITIEFGEDGRVSGSAGCNSYGSSYSLENDTVSFELFAVTMMACLDGKIMEQEMLYLELLQGTMTFAIEGEQLTLRSETAALIYRPATHLSLEGVDWILAGIATEDAIVQTWVDEKISARFEDGTVSGSAGCNNHFADYDEDVDGTLTLGPAGTTRMACESEIMDREAQFLAALEKVASYRTRLETLSLLDTQGELLLQFRADQ